MSRTGVRTLLPYVLHQFNRVNKLSLVNRSFHVTYVSIENDRATWLTKNGMLTYMYQDIWGVQLSERNNGFAYDSTGRVTYLTMVPHMAISFLMYDCTYLTVFANNIPRIRALKDRFLKSIWDELANTDISGKLKLLIKYQVELKSHMLRLAN